MEKNANFFYEIQESFYFLNKRADRASLKYLRKLLYFKKHLIFLGTLSVEEVYRDRDQFASLVREVAAPDVGRMGIEILSFTIKDVFDQVEYLASLGKARTAAVKRDADVGVAQANRDAGIRVSIRKNTYAFSEEYLYILIVYKTNLYMIYLLQL